MDKESFLPLSGFRDVVDSPKSAVISELKKIFTAYGYLEMETPIIERREILLKKYGQDAEKLLYLFTDNGERQVGLRYDLTVPLARFIAGNYRELNLPFKRFEIGPVFRAEKPQKGRYRQFTQADIDIVGSNTGEEELLAIISQAGAALGLKLTILVNSRQVVSQVFEKLGVNDEKQPALLRALDKKDKLTASALNQELSKLELGSSVQKAVSRLFLAEDTFSEVKEFLGDNNELERLQKLVKGADRLGLQARFEASMVRGLDYYTDTIIECLADGYDGGSVIAGGRYDALVEDLVGQKIPSVGISFGVDRLAEAVKPKKTAALFAANLPETEVELEQWAKALRDNGKNIEVYLDSSVELGKQIKYAAKRGYGAMILPLEEAWKKGSVEVKNLETGVQRVVKRADIEDGTAEL